MPNGSRRSRAVRARTGDPLVDEAVLALLDSLGIDGDRDLVSEMLATVAKLARDRTDRGDLKIVNGALREMRSSFGTFAPFRGDPKASVFGSARTHPDEPAYQLAVDLGRALADAGWMVITGGGPGIMHAAVSGAGRHNSFAVTIRLPFEPTAASTLVDDDHLVRFRYFFTRKLTFMKESSAYVVFPGGFGTLDETFELLTLVQTGKESPAPIVLIDPPEDHYWVTWIDFIRHELVEAGLVAPDDLDLVFLTSSVGDAVAYIDGFYRNYHSMRSVDERLCIRMNHAIDDASLATLNEEFADILASGVIERCEAFPVEVDDLDEVDRPRLVLNFNRRHFARLHQLCRRLGDF
ncbi:MAG: TIGR00730 family Rossman fold protein [Microthrixaceae bacterium]|nr:TIGR00730 family Rossman fold protein [Microthrixaceae bacterium]